jgi:hypothetical protein
MSQAAGGFPPKKVKGAFSQNATSLSNKSQTAFILPQFT